MKKLFLVVLALLFIFAFPLHPSAGIIGNVNLTETSDWPAGNVSYNGGVNYGGYYLDYHVSLNGGAFGEAFCVENMDGPGLTSKPYTLLSIDASLAAFNLNPSNYRAAAWVAQNYYTTQKAAAQIAIWEIVMDGVGNFNLINGTFRSQASGWGDWNAAADAIWAAKPTTFGDSNSWALAVNPTVIAGDTVWVNGYQNYLVQNPVPEPATILLLGFGLVGLAGGIKKKLKQ